ncbi:hypothetical protein HRbin19_01043 [bacterium HR19]|nr:hypothetical protein HRbin19_01043 [bacterium HR19]
MKFKIIENKLNNFSHFFYKVIKLDSCEKEREANKLFIAPSHYL